MRGATPSRGRESRGLPRQRAAADYNDTLKEKFKHHPEVKRIARHRHLPKEIYSAAKRKRAMEGAAKRKVDTARKNHSVKGGIPFAHERKKGLVREDE